MVNAGSETLHLNSAWDVGIGLLAHEVAHNLGLSHTWSEESYINDLYRPDGNTSWADCNDSTISNNIAGYNTCRDYLSPLQISKMRNTLVNGISLQNTVAELRESTKNDVIITDSNTVWEDHEIIGSTLFIESGAQLTIKCVVNFSPAGKVIIKPGGKLILDGGTLTNRYGEYWQGIEVWGTTDKNQYPENNPTYQGLLIIKDGGTIENAHHAVSNWRKDQWGQIGGVIKVTDGVFKNNRRDVEFMSYQNYTPTYSRKFRNLSSFTNTHFVSDNNFMEKGLPIQPHVSMWDVDGIVFTNCLFANDVTINKANSTSPNRGIYSLDAGYHIYARCGNLNLINGQPCPPDQLYKSTFRGFQTAIDASGAATAETMTVQQANFNNNTVGINISEFDNISVNRNLIEVGDAQYHSFVPIHSGVVVNNSTGYKIEENTVSTNLQTGFKQGIVINHSGSDDNRVYKNNLSSLNIGLMARGLNFSHQKGLQSLCNTFENNNTAFAISNSNKDGIRLHQGEVSPLKSAGNTFLSNSFDISNSAYSIIYVHNGGTTQPINYSGQVFLQQTTNANTCPSSFGRIIDVPIGIRGLEYDYVGLKRSYTDLNFAYMSLIDDGNTELFKNKVEVDWSNDAWLLRENLLLKTPYLSAEVLLKAANQNILPNGMLLEILLANPEATLEKGFIEELKEATSNTFPEYMIDYVKNNYDSKTLRSEIEGQLAAIHSELSSTGNWIKHLTNSKEEYTNAERLDVALMGDEINNKVGLMDFYISKGSFDKADSVLNYIYDQKKYNKDLKLIENYSDYIKFRYNLGERKLAQLDESEISYLQNLASYEGRVGGYARNILCFFYNICFDNKFEGIGSQEKLLPIQNQKNTEELNTILYDINLYPNPAKDYTTISWEVYDTMKDATFSISDLSGRLIFTGVMSKNKNEHIIDTRDFEKGLYIISFYNNGQLKASKKLVIEK